MRKILLSAVYSLAFFVAVTPATASSTAIELVSFEVIGHADKVDLKWATRTENVNAVFIIERSRDGKNFEEVTRVSGAGKGNFYMEYFDADYAPLEGVSYYRLKQSNGKGVELLHNPISINYNKPIKAVTPGITIAQNPDASNDFSVLLKGFEGKEVLVVLQDKNGEAFFSKVYLSATDHHLVAIDPHKNLSAGEYLVVASVNNKVYSKSITVK